MRNKMRFATFTLSLSFAAVAAGQDKGTPTLEQVTVSPAVTSRPINCDDPNWPSVVQIRRTLDLPASASAEVARKRAKAIEESRALCRQRDTHVHRRYTHVQWRHTHVQWTYRKVGRQVALTVR